MTAISTATGRPRKNIAALQSDSYVTAEAIPQGSFVSIDHTTGLAYKSTDVATRTFGLAQCSRLAALCALAADQARATTATRTTQTRIRQRISSALRRRQHRFTRDHVELVPAWEDGDVVAIGIRHGQYPFGSVFGHA